VRRCTVTDGEYPRVCVEGSCRDRNDPDARLPWKLEDFTGKLIGSGKIEGTLLDPHGFQIDAMASQPPDVRMTVFSKDGSKTLWTFHGTPMSKSAPVLQGPDSSVAQECRAIRQRIHDAAVKRFNETGQKLLSAVHVHPLIVGGYLPVIPEDPGEAWYGMPGSTLSNFIILS
jgi:hypothetical protein